MSTSSPSRRWYRLHVTTWLLLAIVAMPTVLANVVEHEKYASLGSGPANEYGWPLGFIWFSASAPGPSFASGLWRASFARLAMNVAVWCSMSLLTAWLGEHVRRRYLPRLQWSLRTQIVFVAACCALLAWFGVLRQRANRHDEVLRQIEGAKGHVDLEYWGPRWLKLAGADRYRRRIVGVSFQDSLVELVEWQLKSKVELEDRFFWRPFPKGVIPREVLASIQDVPTLRQLRMGAFFVGVDDAGRIGKLTGLIELDLRGTRITDSCLEQMEHLDHLETLHLGGTSITDDGLRHLTRMQHLQELNLSGTAVQGAGLAHLADLENLRVLDLSFCALRAEQLASLASFPRLEELHLHYSAIGDRGVEHVAKLSNLRSLSLLGTGMTPAGLKRLRALSQLETLSLDGQNLPRRGFLELQRFSRLKRLGFHQDWREFAAVPNWVPEARVKDCGKRTFELTQPQLLEAHALYDSLELLRPARPDLTIVEGESLWLLLNHSEFAASFEDWDSLFEGLPRYGLGGGIF